MYLFRSVYRIKDDRIINHSFIWAFETRDMIINVLQIPICVLHARKRVPVFEHGFEGLFYFRRLDARIRGTCASRSCDCDLSRNIFGSFSGLENVH